MNFIEDLFMEQTFCDDTFFYVLKVTFSFIGYLLSKFVMVYSDSWLLKFVSALPRL